MDLRILSEKITVHVFPERNAWIAQCAQYDICAQGPTEEEARRRFDLVFILEVKESLARGDDPVLGNLKITVA